MTACAGGLGRDAVVRYLARYAVSWHVLHAYHRCGLDGAAAALGQCGGAGRDDDEIFRTWQTEAGGRRITYREGSTTAPPVQVPLRELLEYVDQRFTASDRRRLDKLGAARGAAIAAAYPRDGWRSPASAATPRMPGSQPPAP